MSVLDQFSLKGRIALVTGGAGMYGRQIVSAVAEAGAQTYIASRNIEALKQVAVEHQSLGRSVIALQYDQTDEISILKLRDEILQRSGHLDILVNNSVARPVKDYRDDVARFAESMQVNATGVFAISRVLGDVMASQGRGSMINIGSMFGMIAPDPYVYRGTSMNGWAPDYAFHKAGMINLTRFFASYYGSKGVRCNCISPGGLWNEKHPDPFVRQYAETTCLGRLANNTDLMGVVVFLASDASVYITGTNIPVDGGRTAK